MVLDSGLHCSGVKHASPVLVVNVSPQLVARSSRVLGAEGRSARQIATGAAVVDVDESALLTRSRVTNAEKAMHVMHASGGYRTFGLR